MPILSGKRVAILVAEGFEQVEMTEPRKALEEAGAATFIVSPATGEVHVANPDQLRTKPKAVQFARQFFDSGKPIGVICHGPWTLIEAGVVLGRTMTSWPSLKTDLENAGEAFSRKIVEEFAEGNHGAGLSRRAAHGGRPAA